MTERDILKQLDMMRADGRQFWLRINPESPLRRVLEPYCRDNNVIIEYREDMPLKAMGFSDQPRMVINEYEILEVHSARIGGAVCR